jgi:uncharacterized membrane protein
MATTASGAGYSESASNTYDSSTTAWTGWIAFAGIMMIVGGVLAIIQGTVAIANANWAVWANVDALATNVKNWGWVHLILGIVVVLAGLGVFTGNILARTVGVLLAGLSLIVNFMFLPAYPLWGLTIIVLDTLVIWALIVHGGEVRDLA